MMLKHLKSSLLRRPGGYLAAIVVGLALCSGFAGCADNAETDASGEASEVAYSFFVAGHLYGKPSYMYKVPEMYDGSMHPPFRRQFDLIRDQKHMQFGIFTGDIVKSATAENWEEVDREIALLGVPVHFAPGNHDMSNRGLYEQRYGRTFFNFRHEGDLFIVLDPNLDHWNISGEQLAFLTHVLTDTTAVGNVFVFFHQLLWWDSTNQFAEVNPNSTDNRSDSVNFWSDIEPLFRALSSDVYMFAGDIGAHPSWLSCMYYQYENITLIASGMGGGVTDNFIIASVKDDSSVEFELVALGNGGVGSMGKLEEHTPPDDLLRSIREWCSKLWTTFFP